MQTLDDKGDRAFEEFDFSEVRCPKCGANGPLLDVLRLPNENKCNPRHASYWWNPVDVQGEVACAACGAHFGLTMTK